MVIPGQAQWLKEFFDVKMIVSNLAPSPYSFDNGSISLTDLPAGLSLAPTNPGQSTSHSVADIPAGGSVSSDWVLRGDAEGFYGVNATYTGTLDPLGAPLSFQIATLPGAVHVWGGSAITMTVDADDHAYFGDPYLVRVGLTNVSDVPVYNAGVELSDIGRSGYIYQPDQQLGYSTAVIQPGATFWTDYYRLLPEGTGTAPLNLAESFVKKTGGNVDVTSTIESHPSTPPAQVPNAAATFQPGGVKVSWDASTDPTATGYKVFYTPTRDTTFGSSPVATVSGASTTSVVVAHGLAGYYAVSTVTPGGLVEYHELAKAVGIESTATASLSPSTLAGSGTTTVTGSSFGAGKVTLYLDSTANKAIGKATASSAGTFSKSVKVTGVAGGTHVVIAVGADGSTATAVLTVTATMTLKPASAKAGATATATLAGFAPGESVAFHWNSASGTEIGLTTVSSTGGGTATITVPAVGKGTTTVYAVGSLGSNRSAAFTVK
jgi:hypothetical protein